MGTFRKSVFRSYRKVKGVISSHYNNWLARRKLPRLFHTDLTRLELESKLKAKPFVYLPWIQSHGDRLIKQIDPNETLLVPLEIFKFDEKRQKRFAITRFARKHPGHFHKYLVDTLNPIRSKIAGLVVTMDWTPSMRQTVYAFQHMGIPTILIPHEAVFADRQRYYKDIKNGVDYPVTDLILAWGGLQSEIFIERGYPADSIETVGSPKLDTYFDYKSSVSKEEFCKRYNLSPQRPIALFATQPLDSQFDKKAARIAQDRAISDLLDYAELHGLQIIVRYPPSGADILRPQTRRRIKNSKLFSTDGLSGYLSSPEDSIFHSSVVLSINSTMLFEAALMERPSISTRYVQFNQIWENAGIPFALNKDKLFNALDTALDEVKSNANPDGMKWAAKAFSTGVFDGRAKDRVRAKLEDIRSGTSDLNRRKATICNHLFSDGAQSPRYGTCGFHAKIVQSFQYVPDMLGFGKTTSPDNIQDAALCDVFVKWGIQKSLRKDIQDQFAEALSRPQLIIEDGFIRSIDIGLSGTPGLSIIVDDRTAYYDATQPSRLEERISSDHKPTSQQLQRAAQCIALIRKHRISKYNHAPIIDSPIGQNSSKILLIDQRYGDQSIVKGLADDSSFENMLQDALKQFPGSDILIKRHPDATKGGKESYFSDDNLADIKNHNNVYLIDYEINPFSLFDQVSDVFVATSGMGFEALIAGKQVNCYGAPFYSNWGLTQDKVQVTRRAKTRTLEEIFFYSYIESSRYYSPKTQSVCNIEDVIQFIAKQRQS